jgi:hypothetical protein
MGGVQRVVEESNGWGIGTYELDPATDANDESLPAVDFLCAGCGSVVVGDYLVNYEIRRAPLPDLHPREIRVLPNVSPDSADPNVCLVVENIGGADAGPFNMSLYVDRSLPIGGSVNLTGLGAGGTQEVCIHAALPVSGTHQLNLIVDIYRAVPEANENNNDLPQSLARTAADGGVGAPSVGTTGTNATADAGNASPNVTPAGSGKSDPKPSNPQPAPSPSPAQTDLKLSTIKVNGQVLDGKNDCKDGKNTVAVTVKNAGTGKASGFDVRLVVDGNQGDADTQSVNGLDAGKEREVRFENVQLKKGEHTLTASAQAKGETDESDTVLEVTARCGGDA